MESVRVKFDLLKSRKHLLAIMALNENDHFAQFIRVKLRAGYRSQLRNPLACYMYIDTVMRIGMGRCGAVGERPQLPSSNSKLILHFGF